MGGISLCGGSALFGVLHNGACVAGHEALQRLRRVQLRRVVHAGQPHGTPRRRLLSAHDTAMDMADEHAIISRLLSFIYLTSVPTSSSRYKKEW